tara:strand:+ start:1025 stop:4090 length:3066 start_codon:yes stop_codon:yes gene_type:complete
MDDRTKLNLYRGIKSGAFSDRQKLDAFRAIKSNAPNEEVSNLLSSLAFSSLRTGKDLKTLVDERQGRDTENFDYKTGADGRLRSLMSFGETESDREAILKRIVGEDGYVRDKGGQLALTPTGQKIRGMEPIGKNLIIEDEGFSMRDFSDFVGILPETIGSVAGAVIGGGPSFGTGAILGAGFGASIGQGIEESLEQFLGVQTQGLGEVTKDLGKEFLIGAGGEVIGAAVIGAGRRVIGGGKSLAGRVAGTGSADELAEQRLTRMESMVERNYVPSMEAMGAPRFLGFGQKFLENMGKISTRIDNNTKTALLEKDEFLRGLKGTEVEELGETVTRLTPEKFDELTKIRNASQKKIFAAIDDGIDLITKSQYDGIDLNKQALEAIIKSFDAFGKKTTADFEGLDVLLSKIKGKAEITDPATGRQINITGDKIPLFNVNPLRNPLEEYMSEMRNLADPAAKEIDIFLKTTNADGATFKDMSNLRKSINDTLYFGGGVSTKARMVLEGLRGQIDDMLDTQLIENFIPKNALKDTDDLLILRELAKNRKTAMANFREGMQKYEKLAELKVVRSVRDLQQFGDYPPSAISDRFVDNVIKGDSPETLEAVLKAANDPDNLRDAFARSYLKDALEKSNFFELDPEGFNGKTFAGRIRKLGTTGPKLFGKEWNDVQKLSDEIFLSSAKSSIKKDQVDRLLNLNGSSPIALGMKDLLDAQVNLNKANTQSIIKKLKNNDYETFDAVAQALTQPNLTQSEVIKIMKFFDDSPELLENMRNVVLQDILSVVDDKVFSSSGSASSLKQVLSKYKRGTLKQILGKDTEAALQGFADDLVDLGDVSKEGAIAAGSIWANFLRHPINTLVTVTRAKVFANAISTPQAAKAFLNARRAAGNDPKAQAQAMLGAFNNSMVDQGLDVGGSASRAGKIISGTARAVGQLSRGSQQVAPRAVGFGSFEQAAPPQTSIPDVKSGSIFKLPQSSPTRRQISAVPLSPIEKIRQDAIAKTIRQRAKENPAIAATLLGGLGSAGLL